MVQLEDVSSTAPASARSDSPASSLGVSSVQWAIEKQSIQLAVPQQTCQ